MNAIPPKIIARLHSEDEAVILQSDPVSLPMTFDKTCYVERSKVREIIISHGAGSILSDVDELPILTFKESEI